MIYGFAISTRGNVKDVNDDKVVLGGAAICSGAVRAELELPVFAAVFDGVSQGGRGAEASNIASSSVIEHLAEPTCMASADGVSALLGGINKKLVSYRSSIGSANPVATTISGVSVGADFRVVGFNSGDSRVYRFRGGMLVQMTTDHTVTQSLLESGADDYLIDQAEQENAHAITKALGASPTGGEAADVEDFGDFAEGDIYLGCTDGLTGFVEREGIKRVLSARVDMEVAGKTLVNMALHNGSYDNISLFLLARVKGTEPKS